MSMRNATCVGTQTSKVPTRVTLLFIPYTVEYIFHGQNFLDRILIDMSCESDCNVFAFNHIFENERFFSKLIVGNYIQNMNIILGVLHGLYKISLI